MQPPLFQPFRALGYITDSVPFAVQRRGKETFVTVSVGKAWQVYNCGKLTLVLVGPQLPSNIKALACKADLTFAAVGGTVVECKRVHIVGQYVGHSKPIIQMMVMGEQLLTLGSDRHLMVWKIGSYDKPLADVILPKKFVPTCMCHPDTYLNKIVVAGQCGKLLLYNFSTGQLLYTFAGWGSAVKSVVSSPALDVVGCGLADGRAALLNLKYDETVVVFQNAAGTGLASGFLLTGSDTQAAQAQAASGAALGLGACTCLAFRTGAGVPLMAAGGGAGVITIWNLEERKLQAVVQDAHDAPLTTLHFFAGEPLLMSAGADNAVKHWLFDSTQPGPRLLRFRSGHAAPPTVVTHYGEGMRLLSAGADRAFRMFSTIQDQQSRELSQKHTAKRAKKLKIREVELKLGRIVSLDACTVRERDWANVLTAHEGDGTAYVWRLAHFTLGEHELRPPEPPKAGPGSKGPTPGGHIGSPVTSVALSTCGNFGLVGTSAGRIDRYNMQSGIHRGYYGRHTLSAQQLAAAKAAAAATHTKLVGKPQAMPSPQLPAHDASVTGMKVDSCNKLMVSVGLDGQLRIWDFKSGKHQGGVSIGSPATHLASAPGSGLVAVASDDLVLRCFDVEAEGRLVRRFKGHKDRITCIQLSSDSRWLMSSSMDGTLRVWDVPASQCLQVMRLGSPLTSFSLSPQQDLLATCHVNRRGVYLWSNQAVFGNPADFSHNTQPVDVTLPSISQGNVDKDDADKASGKGKSGSRVKIAGQEKEDEDKADERDARDSQHEQGPARKKIKLVITGLDADSDEDEGYAEDADAEQQTTSTSSSQQQQQQQQQEEEKPDTEPPSWQRADNASGAPVPIAPSLVTLSLLPRSQWHSLMHIDNIKARNKAIQPAKKPEAAPFFLPTVAGLARNPQFDISGAAGGADTENGTGQETGGTAATSKVLRVQKDDLQQGDDADAAAIASSAGPTAALSGSQFLQLLRAGSEAADWSSFSHYLRTLSPVALDREVRALQLLTSVEEEGSEEEDGPAAEAVHDLCSLLEAIDWQLSQGLNFEFAAALLQLVLTVHGEAVMERRALRSVAARIQRRLQPMWKRLDSILSDVRCMTAYFGNLQG